MSCLRVCGAECETKAAFFILPLVEREKLFDEIYIILDEPVFPYGTFDRAALVDWLDLVK